MRKLEIIRTELDGLQKDIEQSERIQGTTKIIIQSEYHGIYIINISIFISPSSLGYETILVFRMAKN